MCKTDSYFYTQQIFVDRVGYKFMKICENSYFQNVVSLVRNSRPEYWLWSLYSLSRPKPFRFRSPFLHDAKDDKNGNLAIWHNLHTCWRSTPVSFSRSYVVRPFVVCRLSVTFVRPTKAIVIFGNVSMPFGTLAISWHSSEILRRSSQGNPSVGGVKH